MTAPLFGAPDPATIANPWDLARAIWPGAFLAPWQDLQIEQGRGDWPTVLAAHRRRGSWRVYLRTLALHPLPSLRWRFTDAGDGSGWPAVAYNLRSDRALLQARRLGWRYYCPALQACALGVEIPEIRDVVTGRKHKADVGALARLVAEGVVQTPAPNSHGGKALAKYWSRQVRIAARYPDGLPLFGGA